MTRYVALVEYDRDAAAFGLAIPDCPGCTAMGGSFDAVEANGIAALREWVADYRADGAELPRPRDIIELRSDPSLSDDSVRTLSSCRFPFTLMLADPCGSMCRWRLDLWPRSMKRPAVAASPAPASWRAQRETRLRVTAPCRHLRNDDRSGAISPAVRRRLAAPLPRPHAHRPELHRAGTAQRPTLTAAPPLP